MLLDDLGTFLTVLVNVHMRFDSVHVQKEQVTFSSLNPLGDCPGSLNGGMRDPTKCLVVVQEWWGMNEQIKQQALDIGTQGKFVTMVPDLYRGQVAKNSTAALHLVSNLDYPGEFTITEKWNLLSRPVLFIFTSVVFSFSGHRTPKELTALRKNYARFLSEVDWVKAIFERDQH